MGIRLHTLRTNFRRVLVQAPPNRRLAVGIERLLKCLLAICSYYTGLTGILLRRLLRKSRGALILGYHGVMEGPPTPVSRGHSLTNLEELLIFLNRHLPVTFDDGLVNNVTLAIPLLRKLGIPSTFFVPSGLVGAQHDLWITSLTEMIRTWPGDQLPAEPGFWPALPLRDARERRTTLFQIKQSLKTNESKREEILGRLQVMSGAILRPPEEDRVVDASLLRQMTQPGFTVGAHSRSHPILAGQELSKAREEIAGSRQDLEGLVACEVVDFAYPNGRFADFNDTTRRLVAEAGYRCAVTTEPGMVIQGDDVLALRRCMPENIPAFLAAFDLLIRVWRDRRRPADGTQLVADRFSYLQPESVGDSA
jgi:peptidoglycan/xylan/chitin deacetylase (PgdA/CDA1 family)